ncbi:MAG TPA: cellulose synthase subunit BcsC-related outer membrane protein, partial [Anaeromyxobacteraceae bacterium]|nr:cellulose synthase subunit BcsC-related outer membrane protein [Anaeromyxobacteraceae bacterium]
ALPVALAGRLEHEATPVSLDAGRLADAGGGAEGAPVSARGVELRARWSARSLSADVGTTPIGFPLQNLVGGVRVAVPLGPVDGALEVSRREVTESVLSYAGVRDSATGQISGGVVRDEVRLAGAWKEGGSSRWASLAAGILSGTDVLSNGVFQAAGGADWDVGEALGGRARAGVSLAALGYRRNLRFFGPGQGGYFSPQALVHAGVPLRLAGGEKVRWEVGGEAGVNWLREAAPPGAPGDPTVPARSTTGPALDLRAGLRWPLAGGFDGRVELDAHQAEGYQEIRAAVALAWRPATAR